MTFDSVTILGIIGMSIILVTFLLNQSGRWSTTSLSYDLANALGSLLLIGYAVLLDSLPFVVLNAVWFLVSLRDVVKAYRS